MQIYKAARCFWKQKYRNSLCYLILLDIQIKCSVFSISHPHRYTICIFLVPSSTYPQFTIIPQPMSRQETDIRMNQGVNYTLPQLPGRLWFLEFAFGVSNWVYSRVMNELTPGQALRRQVRVPKIWRGNFRPFAGIPTWTVNPFF